MNEVTSSLEAFEALKSLTNPYAEELWVIALGPQLQILDKEMIFRGTADHCTSHPRDIFRFLILKNASAFMMGHNHPSGTVLPSEQDLVMTRKMHACAEIFQMPLLDHIIFTKEQYFSMADNGYFKQWKRKFRREKY
jgi:DNA repair protein RadC